MGSEDFSDMPLGHAVARRLISWLGNECFGLPVAQFRLRCFLETISLPMAPSMFSADRGNPIACGCPMHKSAIARKR